MSDLVEIFGYAARDVSAIARASWRTAICPHMDMGCSKWNHDRSVCYGTCSVTSPHGDVLVCPIRFYENNYEHLKAVSLDCFPDAVFMLYDEFERYQGSDKVAVALGRNSGKEVNVSGQFSLDWVLAVVQNKKLIEYTGIEVQSVDTTGNYRDAWMAYKRLENNPDLVVPPSEHGINWANVHKRLIPQLIRKGVIFSRSSLVKTGMHFLVPEIVYRKFEEVIGSDIPLLKSFGPGVLSVRTFELSAPVASGQKRHLTQSRIIHFSLDEFSRRFIGSPQSITGDMLDFAVRNGLKV